MLSSRPPQSQVADLRDLIEDSKAVITITDDTVSNPPMLSIDIRLADGSTAPLFLAGSDDKIGVPDIQFILKELGFAVKYKEVR
jgi:hypothetical protein